jgi:hypothetical protein
VFKLLCADVPRVSCISLRSGKHMMQLSNSSSCSSSCCTCVSSHWVRAD